MSFALLSPALHTVAVPPEDVASFDRLRAPQQAEVKRWLRVVNRALALVPSLGTVSAFAAVASETGVPKGQVKTKYYAALRGGWRALINNRGGKTAKVPVAFIPHWHGLLLANRRDTARAFDRFLAQYHGGETIPGMPPPAERGGKLPRGVSLGNLRRYLPRRSALVMARQGIAAARTYLPTGPQDIAHVRPLEYILFDDVELDFLIIVPGCDKPVKLRLLVAMDLCSRVILGYGCRPAVPREDGVEDGLKLRDMKALVARKLRTWGVPLEYPMHYICERATAALPDATKAALAEISDGRIVVHDTSMIVGQVFEFRDKASGNSWGKAWLESFFRNLHSELQDVPGHKGRRYDLAPAELDGRRKELAALVRAGKALPIELRHQFRWPFKTGAEALQELDAALARLHTRTDHGLLCFDRVALWRLNPDDKPKAEHEMPDWLLPQAERLLWETRIESPMERFARLLPTIGDRAAIGDSSLQRLMEEHRRVRFMDMQFRFEVNRSEFIYLPSDAMLATLREGDHYLLWFHPDHLNEVYVTRDRPHLGYVGRLERFTAGRRGDLEDAKAYLAEKARMFGHAQRETQAPAIKRIIARADDLDANAQLIRQGIASLEIETDVIAPRSTIITGGECVETPAVVAAMDGDTRERKAAASVDLVKETLKRKPSARTPGAHDWL